QVGESLCSAQVLIGVMFRSLPTCSPPLRTRSRRQQRVSTSRSLVEKVSERANCKRVLVLLSFALCLLPCYAAADSPSLERIQTIVLKGKPGKLDHLTVDGVSERLFQANKVNNTLDVVDLKAGKLVKQITGQAGIQGLAYAADLGRLYAGLGTGGFC